MNTQRFIASVLLIMAAALPQSHAGELVIAVTGETHGALLPCDCPLEPDGGLARRAAFIKNLRKETKKNGDEFLLVDVGGNAAGGPYDIRPFTKETALIRSNCIFDVMSRMDYDAVAVGDDELAWGIKNLSRWASQLPMVLSNAPGTQGELVPAICYIKRRYFPTGVSAVTVPAIVQLSDKIPTRTPDDPFFVACGVPNVMHALMRILICHTGEETSRRIAKDAPGFDLILNAHSKRGTTPFFIVNGVPIVQFSYETRRVMVVKFRTDTPAPKFISAASERLSESVSEDPEAAALVKKALDEIQALTGGHLKTTITLFGMPFCPYLPPVEKPLLDAQKNLSDWMRLDIRFIVKRDDNGRLTSLHGREELDEARRRAAIREHYPERLFDYLRRRREHPAEPWQDSVRSVGIVPARVRGAVLTGEADAFLEKDLTLAKALGIHSSPTVLINNATLKADPLGERAVAAVCSAIPEEKQPAFCRSLPDCYIDADCRKPGMEVRCINPGTPQARCERTPAQRVPLSIIYPENALYPARDRIKAALVELLPGLDVTEHASASPEGRTLLALYPYDRLPALFFGGEVKKAQGYSDVAVTLKELKDKKLFATNPAASGANFLFKRPRMEGRVDIFIPLSSRAGHEAVRSLLTWQSARPDDAPPLVLSVHPLIYRKPEREDFVTPGWDAPTLERALRTLAVSINHPDKFTAYLKAVADAGGSGYWQEPLAAVGLDPDAIKTLSRSQETLDKAAEEAALCKTIAAGGSVALLIANQEVYIPANPGELIETLETAGK